MIRCLTLLAFLAIAAAQPPSDPAAAIRAARERSNRALGAHDLAAFQATLAPDYVIVRGNGTFEARQALLDGIAADFRSSAAVRYERVSDKIELSAVAPLAAEHGHWTATLPNGKKGYSGVYLAMWRRGDAGWQIRSELFVLLDCDDAAACAEYRK